jgi:hypothetical protein
VSGLTGAVVYALTVPFAAIALTLHYFDVQVRPVPDRAGRRFRAGPPRTTGARSPDAKSAG